MQTADADARIVLPEAFANTVVVVEQISESELRIRVSGPAEATRSAPVFIEEFRTPLSDRDRDLFLDLLANPPAPTDALRKAAARRAAGDPA